MDAKNKRQHFKHQAKDSKPKTLNYSAKKVTRATAQEKGKWIPKIVPTPIESYTEHLPSTSTTVPTTNTMAKQSQSHPVSGTSPLNTARQLAFILRTFNYMHNGCSSWQPK